MGTLTVQRVETEAHADTVKTKVADIARFLQENFGQKLAAFIADIEDPKQVGKWSSGQNSPRVDSELRLRAAYQVFRMITLAENDHTARAWMIGMNPQLEDDSPIRAIADDRHKDVMAAARAYIKGDL
ncbi:XRE family transcriptional regulator [Streptomyces yaizuensis]|uniref:XRE family transcriptional regulator n=1 Tax=Streptomyces yaizuensis TaxID=2989713 RepID=A0ABQ5P292_9ACTN|nr:XRE family transcriptional regulator [Streptomyces sp. YSPA8]GLF96563.1 XRE family transcriptional regulator [Streptomyces sp. YSPA8]